MSDQGMRTPPRSEYVYRHRELTCVLCGEPASIELHVGVGGNYRTVYACVQHDRRPDQYLTTGEARKA